MPTEKRALVLIVEDEALVRMHGCAVLEGAGFGVLEAGSADEAVGILEQHGDLRLLFSDVDLPGGMNGIELAALVHKRWPGIGLLLTSGHQRPQTADLPDDGLFLRKPWKERDVVDRLRAILDRR